MDEKCIITKLPHHIQQKLCHTRPPYRQGKRLTSVKVYTINDESIHLMVCGVPKLQLGEEVKKLVEPYGCIKKIHVLAEYPTEEFTEAYYIKYARIQSARIAKRFIDGKNFYGGSLHVFYAPELETLTETKAKLTQRRRDVLIRIKRNQQDIKNPNIDKFIPKEQFHRKKRTPALPLTEERLAQHYPGETLLSIYNGIPQNIDPRPVSEPSLPSTSWGYQENAPYHPTETIIKTAESKEIVIKSDHTSNKRKNYKGQPVNTNAKVRVVRPQLIDTSTVVKWDTSTKNIFSNPKKGQNSITIKLISNNNDKKKIVIKNPSVSHLIQPSEDLQVSIKEAKSQIRMAMQMK
ncbi:RNA-binding protein 48 isoform X1 [Osmia bicornis bicornis]|uniref:RNA-binding protein 48 isoform X1 n=2 Tax=Osmia bicornis bicornis TaxID=1437191 RepID=UPI0010F7FC95|nr:RNA-binding protein 48 isoform X1 [Osmia bicornis bicornis]XP_046142738.1 RNA-binding protein 48 isoform X1 [Osmia bicornis bicornis]